MKPTTSKPANSENYLIGKGFHKERATDLIRELKEGHISRLSVPVPQYNSIINASMKLMERQTKIIIEALPVLREWKPRICSIQGFQIDTSEYMEKNFSQKSNIFSVW